MPNVRSAYGDSVRFYGCEDPRELVSRFGSPLYVYNESILRSRLRDLTGLSDHPGFRVNYSSKANTNPAILRVVREEGCIADAMSPAELRFALMAGFEPENILYVCNNVSREEMEFALSKGVLISVDSLSQAERFAQIAPGGRVMARFNPGIGAGHSDKVVTAGKKTKFGIDPDKADELMDILGARNVRLAGINQHIGSLFMDGTDYVRAMDVLLALAERFDGLEIIDFGGGFGIPYEKYAGAPRLDMKALGAAMDARLNEWSARTGYAGKFYVEPGRYAVAECGAVLGTVHAVKRNGPDVYAGTDIGFSVLARPMLYNAFHDIEIYRENGAPDDELVDQTVVGNICESGDILAKHRMLPRLKEDDVVALLDAGAYGYVMASDYNQRPRPAEVMIGADGKARLIRRRETFEDLCATLDA